MEIYREIKTKTNRDECYMKKYHFYLFTISMRMYFFFKISITKNYCMNEKKTKKQKKYVLAHETCIEYFIEFKFKKKERIFVCTPVCVYV